jgi:hypothetical protein
MDDTAQQQSTQSGPGVVPPAQQPGQTAVVNRQVAPPVHDSTVIATTPVTPAPQHPVASRPMAPVSPRNPEQAPIAAPMEKAEPTIEASEPSVEVSQELKDAGVEKGSDAIEHPLPREVKDIGAELAKEAVQVQTPVQTPPAHVDQSFEESMIAAKASKTPKSSLSWYVRLVLREWKKKLLMDNGEVPK